MESWIDRYNVVWETPSRDSTESMPCGGGDIGLNVWVEDHEILFYLARSGAFDENNTLLKLGRVRLRLTPDPFETHSFFRQELCLRDGSVRIQSGGVRVHLWVEVMRPVIHVEVTADSPVTLEARYESWRTSDRPIGKDERMECFSFLGTSPEQIPLVMHRDEFEPYPDKILWYHRNDNADLVFDKEVIQQHLSCIRDQLWNPQTDFTFGGMMRGPGLVSDGISEGVYSGTPFRAWSLKSDQEAASHSVEVFLHSAQTGTVDAWRSGLMDISKDTTEGAWERNCAWWEAFWKRSHIVLNPETSLEDPLWRVGRNYQLVRYMLGCNAYGEYPSKFNGSLFTSDSPPYTPDFRQWGGGSYTAQNQRLLLWPMLKSGDFDLMQSQFEFYRRALPNAELRTKAYWGHAGACFTEQLENFGLPAGEIYETGWGGRGVEPRPGLDPGALHNAWCEDVYDTVLEFCLMLLDVQQFTGRDISAYLPLIESCLVFFDQHYRTEDDRQKLVIFPGSACETYKRALNPSSTVAGLQVVISRLLVLPSDDATAEMRAQWRAMLTRIPPLPFREKNGRLTIAPAETWERINNQELPQMYSVFPFGLYGVDRPDLEVALDTWRYGADTPEQKGNFGWKQDAIWCARLGLADEAAALTTEKLADAERRFPAFWGPNFDWIPDLNHGGSAMIALQEMLMQTDGRKILLRPAWPTSWDVDFKLHAPFQTVVEGNIRRGQLQQLHVTPPQRRADVVFIAP